MRTFLVFLSFLMLLLGAMCMPAWYVCDKYYGVDGHLMLSIDPPETWKSNAENNDLTPNHSLEAYLTAQVYGSAAAGADKEERFLFVPPNRIVKTLKHGNLIQADIRKNETVLASSTLRNVTFASTLALVAAALLILLLSRLFRKANAA